MESSKGSNYNFNIGDIVVRCYKSGRESICMYYSIDNYDYVVYLDESFNLDGGMHQLDSYGAGYEDYVYRLATLVEVDKISNKLSKYRILHGNSYVVYFCDLNNLFIYLNKYKNSIRREKLEIIVSRL